MSGIAEVFLDESWVAYGDHLQWRSAPLGRAPEGELPTSLAEVADWALSQTHQFAAVFSFDDGLALVTDIARSIPLFTCQHQGSWVVASDINVLLSHFPNLHRDQEAAEQFLHAGIVLGTRTLIEGVEQVPAGTVTTLREGEVSSRHLYRRFRYTRELAHDDDMLGQEFLTALRAAAASVVETAGDRLLALPLSGGIDSRLLAVLIAEAKPKNVLAFTYGVADSKEAQVSRGVAEALGIPWVFVESDPAKVSSAWKQYGADFLRHTWAGASLPHYQDWYALHVLTNEGTLPEGSIILPGHTIVGNLHDEEVCSDESTWSKAQFARLVLDHHLSLQNRPEEAARLLLVREVMAEFFKEVNYDGSMEERQSLIEWFNIRERQAKYINNSMRPYEFFGLDWALPMLDATVVEAWQKASTVVADEARIWYGNFTNKLYAEATNQDVSYYAAGVATLPPRWKQLGVSIARKTGISTFLSRALSARVQYNHPMAFQAFLGDKPRVLAITETLKGSSLHAVFVRLFLANEWIDNTSILPE